jgi:Nucleotidyl transferase AbiEii toxin, Type IV TA system
LDHPEPRNESDYSDRQVEAARRVLIDLGQVLASFRDAIVVIGGWVPDLLLPDAEPKHIGSIDVDLALDAARLGDGRYAEILKLLIDTQRYKPGDKAFQLVTDVALGDGEAAVRVEVESLAPSDVKLRKNRPKLVEDFRVLQFPACAAAFKAPIDVEVAGRMISGAMNRVHVQVASLSDLIVMKAHAIAGRDTPKDVYDLCYCLDAYPGGIFKRGVVQGGQHVACRQHTPSFYRDSDSAGGLARVREIQTHERWLCMGVEAWK